MYGILLDMLRVWGREEREARSIILFFPFNCVHIFTLTETKLIELSIEL